MFMQLCGIISCYVACCSIVSWNVEPAKQQVMQNPFFTVATQLAGLVGQGGIRGRQA